jgi:mannose-6-phosphate isomerase
MKNNLYPFKFKPIIKDKIWGGNKLHAILGKPIGKLPNIGESWEISGFEGEVSKVKNGFLKGNNLNELVEIYMNDLVGDHVYEKYGNIFPLLIKFIDAKEALSIQVHPDDKIALKRHNSFGKTEMWYVMQADKDSYLISGFNSQITPNEYVKAIENNNIESLVAKHKVVIGDVFFMPAGRVHAIGAGIMLAEIQQTSDLTYRIYDFNRCDDKGKKRELHTELAKEALDYKIPSSYKTDYKTIKNQSVEVVKSPYFVASVLEIDKNIERDYYALDSFMILICVDGKADIEYDNKKKVSVKKGETVLIPSELSQIKLLPTHFAKFIEVYCP